MSVANLVAMMLILLTNLHTTTEAEDEMEGRLLLDVVIRKGAAILKLLASENQSLLVGGDALLVLNLGLDIVDSVGRLNLEGNGLAGQGLDKDLHYGGVTMRMLCCISDERR
jgi:hypothetical protein